MINSKLRSMFDDQKPVVQPTIFITVDIHTSKLMDELARCYESELYRVAGSAGARLLDKVDREVIRRYLTTAGWMRVMQTTASGHKSFAGYREFYRKLAVPVLAYQLFIGIGPATDRDYGIQFVPVATIEGKELLSPDEMKEVSRVFFSLQNSGFKLVAGLPQDPDGELDFMAMSHVHGIVKSYKKSHPVYGFLASFFAQQQLNETIGMMCRIVYGYETDYAMNIAHLVASIGGGD